MYSRRTRWQGVKRGANRDQRLAYITGRRLLRETEVADDIERGDTWRHTHGRSLKLV